MSPGRRTDGASGRLAAGDRHCRDAIVGDERGHGVRPDEQRLEHALGRAGAAKQILERQRALRDVRGVLEEAHVAGHQRRRGKPDHLPEGEIPGHDRQHHAERLEADRVARVGRGGDDLRPHELLAALGVVTAGRGALGRLVRRRTDQLPHLQRHQPAERLPLALQNLSGACHDLGALAERTAAPGSEGCRRARQLRFHLWCALHLEDPQSLAVGRVDALDLHASNVMQPRRSGWMSPQPSSLLYTAMLFSRTDIPLGSLIESSVMNRAPI